jgi:hypothetical protein
MNLIGLSPAFGRIPYFSPDTPFGSGDATVEFFFSSILSLT